MSELVVDVFVSVYEFEVEIPFVWGGCRHALRSGCFGESINGIYHVLGRKIEDALFGAKQVDRCL